jgi:hypothetical protein
MLPVQGGMKMVYHKDINSLYQYKNTSNNLASLCQIDIERT